MAIRTTVVGSYPKPPEEGQTFTVRKTLHALEKETATVEDLHAAQDGLVRTVIAEHDEAGIDLITDGQGRWDDILTPFARNMAGFEIGGLLRWFDNNTYYRRPVCTGPVEWRGPSSVDAWRFASEAATAEVKAVIPGPITFARGSVDEHYADHEAFVLAVAGVLAQEARELEAAGAKHIQIDEPALLGAPEDLDLAIDAIGRITGGLEKATTILCTYFGDAKRLGASLFRVPVDTFGLDFVSGPANEEVVRDLPADKKLQAGIADARNTSLESFEQLRERIEDLGRVLDDGGRLTVSPSAGLEFLPREKARAKLERLSEAASSVDL